MLQSIRDKTRGWIAYLIVFLISIPFALWGVNSYFGGGEAPPVAVVDGQEITQQALDSAYANYRRRLAQMFGGSIPEAFADEAQMKEQVLSQMIEEFALRSYVEENNYRVGDNRLNQIIRSMDTFQTNGQFDPEIYRRQIASLGYSTAGFESELRRTSAMQQLRTGISATAFSIPKNIQKMEALKNQTRSIRVITRPVDLDAFEVSQEEVSTFFEENQSRYMTDEQVKVDYIELSLDSVKANIEVSSDQIQDRYDQSKDAYTSTEIRSASHILLSLSEDATEEENLEAEEKIKDIRSEIESGADFAELAAKYSQDPVSAEEGGDLGEIERGMMVQPFEAALFDLGEGEVSEPVKTQFGWHLIKLKSVSGGNVQSLDEVRDAIEDEIKTQIAENQIYDLTENLANLAYEQPDSLLPASEQLGLAVETSDWFSRSAGEGIASEPNIRQAAFSADILTQELNSQAIELADNRIVFIRLNDHKPSRPRDIAEVRDGIVEEIKRNKAQAANIEAGELALEALRSGKPMETVAEDWGVNILEPGPIGRISSEVEAEIVNRAFTMPSPQDGGVYEGISRSNGAYSVIELLSVDTNVDRGMEAEQLESFQASIANQEFQSLIEVIGRRAEVVRTPAEELDF